MANDILIVDDEADIRDLVAGILDDEGFTTRTARDSDSALQPRSRSAARAFSRSARRAPRASRTPSGASDRAVASPMPEDAPVMTTTFPARSIEPF